MIIDFHKSHLKWFLFSLIIFSAGLEARSELEYVVVEVKGTGDSSQEAINAAVAEAIGRVNGKSVAAKNAISQVSKSLRIGDQKISGNSKTMKRDFSEATKGIVDSYEVLSETKNERGQFVAKIKARIAKLKLSKSASRLRIAVLPFSGSETFSRNFSNSLTAKLVSSRRFTVLDRQNMEDIAGERAIATTSPLTSVSEIARLGSTLNADYIVVGHVEDVNSRIREIHFPTINRTFKVPEGKATISYKIIDISTSQVKFADNAIHGFDQSSFAKVMNGGMAPDPDIAMAEIASSKVGTKILDAIYPLMIVGIDNDTFTLNQGGDLIKKDAVYAVFERGQKIYDPYTKESLGRAENKVAEIKITRTAAKMSSAILLKGDISVFNDFKVGKFVCRIERQALSNNQKEKIQIQKKIQKKKTNFDDDW
jgi:curli biogenesis system outer membrane secretion channel CsgG